MPRCVPRLLTLFILLFGGWAAAEEPPPTGAIAWSKDLTSALATAAEDKRIVMVCVNAKFVEGRQDEEPAAKGLREVIYKEPRVVKRSREFVCVLLTPKGSSAEYGELRALGIDGRIVSPQHIFISPDGTRILHRKEYWPYGKGGTAVKALLEMMAQAQKNLADKAPGPQEPADAAPPKVDPAPQADPAPQGAEARAAWIARLVEQVATGGAQRRDEALEELIGGDKEGDCIAPLAALMPEHKKNSILVIAIIRALGRDGLFQAALPIAAQLKHKDERVRGNAAVSLEYIGCREKKVIAALKRSADKEKDESIANHAYRALGRCASKDAKIRTFLLKKAGGAKSEYASYGPCIGLAYFEGDKKAARGVEKLLKKIGVPGSRRGGGQNAVKRSLVSWTLASIGDPKSGKFVREELMSGLEHVKAEWVGGLMTFWDTVARVCEGQRELMPGVEDGVRGAVSYIKRINLARYGAETRHLMDEYRKGREAASVRPKGDDILNDERS